MTLTHSATCIYCRSWRSVCAQIWQNPDDEAAALCIQGGRGGRQTVHHPQQTKHQGPGVGRVCRSQERTGRGQRLWYRKFLYLARRRSEYDLAELLSLWHKQQSTTLHSWTLVSHGWDKVQSSQQLLYGLLHLPWIGYNAMAEMNNFDTYTVS